MASASITKLEFVFWEIFEQAQTMCLSTSACAYAAILGIHAIRACIPDIEEKDITEIIIIVHSKFVKQKIIRVIFELRKAAQNFQKRCTGAKTLLSKLRRQALQEIQNIQKLTYVNVLHTETDNAESLFSLTSSFEFEDVDDNNIDIYDKDTLSCLLTTQPLRRRSKPKMRPLAFGEKGGAAE